MSKTPLLIYSDAPDGITGLGRIARDLATHIHHNLRDEFKVGTYGYGMIGSESIPWPQYNARNLDCISPYLKTVWDDFSQGREGVLMPIMPPSWMFGLVHPDLALQEDPKIASTVEWLKTKPFQIWPYLAIESCGPGMKFNAATCSTIVQCAKPLFYSRFGQKVAENSDITGVPYIHHGIYTDKFKRPAPDVVAKVRDDLGCDDKTVLVGCCATNTGRKRLGTLFAAFAEYHQRYEQNSKLWLHTNKMVDCWNIPELCADYGFERTETIACSLSSSACDDEWMSNFYSACNVTVLPTFGEGFGYPIVESMACGTPCVTGSFACEGELGTHCIGYNTTEPDGIHNLLRPHYDSHSYAFSIHCASKGDYMYKGSLPERVQANWSWESQWPKFREWLLK